MPKQGPLKELFSKILTKFKFSGILNFVLNKTKFVQKFLDKTSVVFGAVGSAMNIIVINANDGKMPVFTKKKISTEIHCVANEDTKYPFLSDWIELKFEPKEFIFWLSLVVMGIPRNKLVIASPGDILIFLSRFIIAATFLLGVFNTIAKRVIIILEKNYG